MSFDAALNNLYLLDELEGWGKETEADTKEESEEENDDNEEDNEPPDFDNHDE